MKKKFFVTLQLTFGLLILFTLFYNIGIGKIIENLSKINFPYLFLIILFMILNFLLSARGLLFLIRPFNSKAKFLHILDCSFKSFAYGAITPGKLGEASLIPLLKKKGLNYGRSSAIFIADKIISLFLFSALAIVGVFVMFGLNILFSFIGSLVLLSSLFYFAFFSYAGRRLIRKLLGKRATKFKEFHKTILLFAKKYKKELLGNFVTTLIRILTVAFTIKLILIALGSNIALLDAIYVKAITTLITFIPITINGLGTKEVSGVYLLTRFSIPLEIGSTMYLLALILNYLIALAIFLLGSREFLKFRKSVQ